LSAEAAAFRRRFKDSEYGDVPIVKPAVDETTYCQQITKAVVANLVKGVEHGST